MHRIIVFAIPLFALAMAAEFAYGWFAGRNTYRLNDSLASLSQGLLSQAAALSTRFFQIGLYELAYPRLALFRGAGLWDGAAGVVVAVVLYDFCDYWLHRSSHESAFFWAAHVVHHQSQCMNLSTALRQESLYPVVGCLFFLPLALAGVPPDLFGTAGLVVLLYQFWIHTEHVGSLGWFDRVFSSPSNHRVHHAVNDRYLDRNYGAVLIVWDRLFGTFEPEQERCVYGTRTPLASWNPLWALAQVYVTLWHKARAARGWRARLGVWWRAPGWQPPGAEAEPPFDLAVVQRYDPPLAMPQAVTAAALFAALVLACCALLWQGEDLGPRACWTGLLGAAAGLWVVGALLAGRLGWLRGAVFGLLATGAVFAACIHAR